MVYDKEKFTTELSQELVLFGLEALTMLNNKDSEKDMKKVKKDLKKGANDTVVYVLYTLLSRLQSQVLNLENQVAELQSGVAVEPVEETLLENPPTDEEIVKDTENIEKSYG